MDKKLLQECSKLELKEYSVVFRWTKEESLKIMAYNPVDAREQVEAGDFDESNFEDAGPVCQAEYTTCGDIVIVGEPELIEEL